MLSGGLISAPCLRFEEGLGHFWCVHVDESEAFGNKSYRLRIKAIVLHASRAKPQASYSLSDVVFEIFWRNSCVNNKERHRSFLFT
ncbi:hypothetical protein B7R56_16460 [Pseudomonas savastanoi pv. retacarpa]|nr:hypothetical protein DXU85_17160 [Pseudomonas savastanoi]OSR27373.1 hypothetical protein B7R56_16460 [Pseudomonas savastanoi pv. retacarpa]PAB28226.1 hypothetical protein CC202_18645 [Pseudomonas savastanoi]PAB30372.1 hypothetical protein CCZ00_17160 [Pseudomonas savastanoi pv. fraxini]TSC35870.1 hypothetical protein FOM00_16910 [Pseudomonas sp. ST1]